MTIRFLGIEIERRTDVLAFAAFLLAAANAVYQVHLLLRGPEVVLFPPEQILIKAERYPENRVMVRFAAKMAYVNVGSPGHNAAITSEGLRFDLGGKTYRQGWQAFTSFQVVAEEGGTAAGERSALSTSKMEDANPFTIGSGSTVAHETFFAPNSALEALPDSDSYLRWADLLDGLEGQRELTFVLTARVHGRGARRQVCTIEVDDRLKQRLRERSWYAPSCVNRPVPPL